MIADGSVRAPQPVQWELFRRDDDIRAWAAGQNGLFVPLTIEVQ